MNRVISSNQIALVKTLARTLKSSVQHAVRWSLSKSKRFSAIFLFKCLDFYVLLKYCLKLDNRSHVGFDEFKKLNWLPTKERVFQCICVNIFKFFNDMSPEYTSEIFHPSHRRHNTRASTLMLDLPFRKSCFGQKTLSYLGPKTWNTLPAEIKLQKNVNTFKHDIKKLFFEKLQKDTDDIFIYY